MKKENNYILLKNRYYIFSLFLGIVFLIASLFINYFAGIYSIEKASNPVTDIILSNIPVFDVDFFFAYGAFAFIALIGFLCAFRLERFPFVLKSIALFVIIRSIFISLTHMGPFPDMMSISPNFINKFTFGSDLFFSGHTGMPFLIALIFWKNRKLRYIFLALSLIFGAVVLLGHYHYTIDVLSAFFITFGIYHIAVYLFKKDYQLLLNGLEQINTVK